MHAMTKITLGRNIPSTNLFVMPGVFKDIARLADFWGTLDEYRQYKTEEQADLAALKRDYRIVALNIKVVIDEYEQQSQKKPARTRDTRKSS